MPSTDPISKAKSIKLSSNDTTVLQHSTISSSNFLFIHFVSFTNSWNNLTIPSQCNDSSRTDHVII